MSPKDWAQITFRSEIHSNGFNNESARDVRNEQNQTDLTCNQINQFVQTLDYLTFFIFVIWPMLFCYSRNKKNDLIDLKCPQIKNCC